MIKITKHLHINILTVIITVLCFIFGFPKIFLVTYAVMVIHEMAHLIAAKCIGLRISHIALQPFGVNLKLKNKIINSLSDEIILYISGPLVNAIFALFAAVIGIHSDFLRLFYMSNIMLFIMNMLPALPLDGGIILRKILIYRMGSQKAARVMSILTVSTAVLLMSAGVWVLFKTRFNFSLITFSLLLAGNAFTQKEKYNVDFVREIMFCSSKKKDKVHHVILPSDTPMYDAAKRFYPNRYNIVYMVEKNGKIKEILTETQVINQLMDNNITVS